MENLVRTRLLGQLRQRLENAHELALSVHERLVAGEGVDIDSAVARLETVAQEFKLLAEEYQRLPSTGSDEDEGHVEQERGALEATVRRIARDSAVTGGLLERMVTVSRGLLSLLGGTTDGTYRSSGRGAEIDARGIRLREWV